MGLPELMRADLVEFLRDAAAAPFAYGEWDCAMTLANWLERQTGRDPAVELRRRYHTRRGWLRIVARAGGLVPLVGGLALAVGMREVAADELAAGDVGVVMLPALEGGHAGAIYGAGRWVLKLRHGLTGARLPAVRAWGLRRAASSPDGVA